MTHICNRATEACGASATQEGRTVRCICLHAVPHEPFIEPGNPTPSLCTEWEECKWTGEEVFDTVKVRCTRIKKGSRKESKP